MLDPSDQLAARLARDGDPEPIEIEETDTNYAIGWKGNYRIEGRAFVYIDRKSGRIITILGYPTAEIARLGERPTGLPRWQPPQRTLGEITV